nr:S9 family peptidase [candidate division Zixibacteria bacterium]
MTTINSYTSSPAPPVAKKVTHTVTVLGHERSDDYFWMRDRENPEVTAYLEAENAYTDQILKHTENLQDKIYNEILGRIKEIDLSVPIKLDDYYYYSRTEEGKEYRIYCRKKGSLEAVEEILLDLNQLAEGKEFLALGVYRVSPDHKLLAYAIDDVGSERYNLHIKNLETSQILPDYIEDIAANLEWANDNRTFFYTVHDDTWRPYRLLRHSLGEDPGKDRIIYEEPDDGFWLGISKSKSRKYLFLSFGNKTTSEHRFLDADNPRGNFRVIHPRQQDMKYNVDHHGDKFYIMTNENAKNYKLMVTPVNRPAKKNWKEIISHDDSVKIDDFELFKDYMVVYLRENGLQKIMITGFNDHSEYTIDFPEPAYSIIAHSNPDFNGHMLRFTYESLVTPESVYDYDLATRKRELKKQTEIPSGYNPDEYQSERIFAPASDGRMIPISLVYKKGITLDGRNPLYLYGYGAYGANMDPWFSVSRMSLLDRGFVFAIAHIRGGGEMGRYWYDEGKLFNKKNTFTDFIACAEYLIKNKYTSREKLVIAGGSAGGMLVGAVVNMKPELFRAAVAQVPFVDVINTMLDETIPLTVLEYEEWGNPGEKDYYDYMSTYSPYDNVEAKAYPNMLVLAGLNDTRVQYWEPAKWVAKLRAMKTDNNRLLLKTNMGAGHGGVSGRYERIRETALEYAFILDILGIKD